MAEADDLFDCVSGFVRELARPDAVGDVPRALAVRVAGLLGLLGAGVSLLEGRQLHAVAAPDPAVGELERLQEACQLGPGLEALASGQAVAFGDLDAGDPAARWPDYTRSALRSGIRAVAAVPLALADGPPLGVLGLYADRPREWAAADLRAARLLADLAAGYLCRDAELEQQRHTNEQLQRALDSRIVIEQAKGVLAASRGIGMDEAFQALRRHARDHNARIHDVAAAVVNLGLQP